MLSDICRLSTVNVHMFHLLADDIFKDTIFIYNAAYKVHTFYGTDTRTRSHISLMVTLL